MSKSKTIFCDIDGTLITHMGGCHNQIINNNQSILLPNTIDAIQLWDKLGYNIILTSGRKEGMRKMTEEQLINLGISYDKLIMGIGSGDRIIINDRKENGKNNTCYAINTVRNKGINYYDFSSNNVVISDNQPKEVEKPWGKES